MRQKKEQCERENAKMLEFAGKIGEIKGTISITHYPQGVVHLIHSFKLIGGLKSKKNIFSFCHGVVNKTLGMMINWSPRECKTFYSFKSVERSSEVIEEEKVIN